MLCVADMCVLAVCSVAHQHMITHVVLADIRSSFRCPSLKHSSNTLWSCHALHDDPGSRITWLPASHILLTDTITLLLLLLQVVGSWWPSPPATKTTAAC
jgi:hypothetical protein